MTVEEARRLNKGDYIYYNNKSYKVLHTKEARAHDTNEVYVRIKCTRKTETLWLPNSFAEVIE